MKKTTRIFTVATVVVLIVAALVSCGGEENKNVWDDAIYKESTMLGSGSKTVIVELKVEENFITFTLFTDASTVGAALVEHGLIEGEEGAYGMYVKKVNGITADYDVDGHYWAFYIDGEYALTGVDTTAIDAGRVYRLEYAK